ncbi:MAG TPA: adenylate/guanylate cyclase domain-containing protein [Thermoanaerobaculia bacterium]|nr:adenylate/guanylate cyclase domain-containing protein [Thermoanaerobaculia bacterium]
MSNKSARTEPPKGTVTVMFTDIVGSTALRDAMVAEYGEAGNQRYRERCLDPHDERIRALLGERNGFEVKTNGDSFMAAFDNASDAVLCAVSIQRSLRTHPIATDRGPLAVRIGMHTGAVTLVETNGKPDYDGHTVNIAARVEALLTGGERVYCSGITAADANLGDTHIRKHPYGPYVLKGVSAPIEIFDLLWDKAMQPEPPPKVDDRLPYPWLTPWIGRDHEMTEVEDALRKSRLVTLHGTGGVGKTRLAVETLLSRRGGLPRDLVFVSLENAADTPEGFLVALRDALGLTEVDAPDLVSLRKYLHGGDRLLLLDNFESVKSAAKAASEIAATPGVRVLVTSQQALHVGGERVVDLNPMTTEGDLKELESYRLFVGLAQQRDARWQPNDDAAMRAILAATDGLPYLIELIAAVAPKRQLQQLAKDLKEHRAKVQERPGFAHADRHLSTEACLEWAISRLPEGGSQALQRLAVFAGGFDAEAAEAIATTPLATLDALVDASLVRFDRESGRYTMLSTTRHFVRELVDHDERLRLDEAHARWFIELLDNADHALRGRDIEAHLEARGRITSELDNVQQAIAWSEKTDLDFFARAVYASDLFFTETFRFSERVRLNEALLARRNREENPKAWATSQNNLGLAYEGLPTGDRAQNLANAIACFQAALHVRTERDFPEDWATIQNNLGTAYTDVPTGDRAENLANAIVCFQAALRVWTTERDFPAQWAMTQNNLGTAYGDLPTGDRAENLANAIACYQATLRVWTEHDFPADWAMTQNNLGIAYRNLPTGDRAENLANAIACYQAALRNRTERDFPAEWARTQNNLGIAYRNLPTGDRAENLANAIACYQAALRVRTERDFPAEWARTQNNLGNTYGDLPTGDRAENLANAIACYKAALRVRTERDFPADWATTQNNLGTAYQSLPTGDRAENLANAIACYQAALRVWTERDFPADWAMTQNNLGAAYADLPTGDRAENLANAIACFQPALRVRTERDFPADWAQTQSNLGDACADLPTGEAENIGKAIACYQAAERGYSAVGMTHEAEDARKRAASLAESPPTE